MDDIKTQAATWLLTHCLECVKTKKIKGKGENRWKESTNF